MSKIEEIDKNFKINTTLNEKDIVFYNVKNAPFDLYGFYDKSLFTRLPKSVAENTSERVAELYTNTSGGRVRFKTDSQYVAILVKIPSVTRLPHMPLAGSTGFDLYTYADGNYEYHYSLMPTNDVVDEYEAITYFDKRDMRDITINFPLYNDVSELYIGLSEDSRITGGDRYVDDKPIVYYGSSITQGGCASRPGNSYPAILSRRFNRDFINLGFSGSAKAEIAIAEYIASLDMCCFVYDYDFNAPTPEYLEETHERMYKIIRKAQPKLPIIAMSRPCKGNEAVLKLKEIIVRTIKKHCDDENLYFVDGTDMYNYCNGDRSVDSVHPNDYGFKGMADCVANILKNIL